MHNDTSNPVPAPTTPKGLKRAGLVAGIAASVVVIAGLTLRSSETVRASEWSQARAVPSVSLVPVRSSDGSQSLTFPGTMAAWNAARLFARVNGYVRSWSKDIGAEVSAGTPLGLIDTPELDQQIEQAQAALTRARASASLARSTARRWNDLLGDHSVSQQEADEKNGDLAVKLAAVKGAEADLRRLLAMKGYATIRAPFTGVVTARNADIGDLVGPGASGQQPLFSLADASRIRLYVSVPQAYGAAMTPGLTAKVGVPDYPQRQFDARVVGTSNAINPQTGSFEVQLVANNPGALLKPGGYAQVNFAIPRQRGALTVPSSALIFRAAGMQVATVGPDSRIHLHKVTIGRDSGGTVEIVAGLSAGTSLVDNPTDSIAEGERVQVSGGQHA